MKLTKPLLKLGAIVLLMVALGIWVSSIYWQPRRAVAKYKRRLLSAGERLSITELFPPVVLPESNSAALFQGGFMAWRSRNSATLLETNPPPAMRLVCPGKAMIGAAQPALIGDGANTWEEAEGALANETEDLELLGQVTDRPSLDFRLDYRQGFVLLLPHLAALKRASQQLSAAAVLDLHRGDTASAASHVRAILALVKGMHDERLVISQLVRMAIAQIAMAAHWELLQSADVTETQLALLQRDWMQLEFLAAAEDALAMERAMAEQTLQEMRNSSSNFSSIFSMSGLGQAAPTGNSWEKAGAVALNGARHSVWRLAWSYPDELRFLQGDQELLESLRRVRSGQPFNEALRQQQARLNEIGINVLKQDSDNLLFFNSSDSDPRSLFSRSVQSLQRFINRLPVAEAARQMTVAANSLKRFALKHGHYPSDLTELIPEFLPAVPKDPVSGQALRYHLNGDGTFKLYSIGEDLEDNAGDPSSPTDNKSFGWQRGRDWVWPAPATKEELKKYYEEHAAKRNSARPLTQQFQSMLRERFGFAPSNYNNTTK